MELQGSLPCSQQPAVAVYPEPGELLILLTKLKIRTKIHDVLLSATTPRRDVKSQTMGLESLMCLKV